MVRGALPRRTLLPPQASIVLLSLMGGGCASLVANSGGATHALDIDRVEGDLVDRRAASCSVQARVRGKRPESRMVVKAVANAHATADALLTN